jgi:transcriptional regulator with XRE-family HTH domain
MDKLERKRRLIAKRIATILEAKGWSQQDLADAAGKGKSYISAIMAGEANLTLASIVNLEEALREEIISVTPG